LRERAFRGQFTLSYRPRRSRGGGEAKLLCLHNGAMRATVSGLERRFAGAGLQVEMVRACGGETPQPAARHDACFVSGSPHGAQEDIDRIHREHDWLRALAERGAPMPGICFGSRILAAALCGRDQVFRRATCEVGYMDIEVAAATRRRAISGRACPCSSGAMTRCAPAIPT
jgi:GMP synthase-like glutamine amidotransferase